MATISEILKPIFDEKGIPEWVWKPIMLMESGGNPNSWNDPTKNGGKEDSRGLYQINILGNPRFAGENLFDPATNATIARDYFILPAWNKVRGNTFMNESDKTAYVWKNGIRPAWNDTKNQAIRNKTAEVLSGGLINKETDYTGSTPPTGGNSGVITKKDGVLFTIPIPMGDDLEITKSAMFHTLVFIIGAIILILTLYSMFLMNSPIGQIVKGAK